MVVHCLQPLESAASIEFIEHGRGLPQDTDHAMMYCLLVSVLSLTSDCIAARVLPRSTVANFFTQLDHENLFRGRRKF